MNNPRLLFFFFLICSHIAFTEAISGMQPPPGYDDKSIKELLTMLDSASRGIRENATAGIAWQLGREKNKLTNVDAELVRQVYSRASILVTNDESSVVRVAGITVLLELSSWTNTSPVLMQSTNDKDQGVRLGAITALLQVSRSRHEQMPPTAISRLEECLDPKADSNILWQAAWAAGESRSPQFVPLLQTLSQSSNTKVRRYALEAIDKIKLLSAPEHKNGSH